MMTQANFPSIPPATTIATTLLQRKQINRKRFDSADYAMALQHQRQFAMSTAANPLPQAPNRTSSDDFSDWVQCEVEPDPEPFVEVATPEPQVSHPSQIPPQRVQRVRLQRFDSADWALKHAQEKASGGAPPSASSASGTVAHLLLERHSYQTVSFVDTPIQQNFVRNA